MSLIWESTGRTPHIWYADLGDLHFTIDLSHGVYTGRISAPNQSSTQISGYKFAEVEARLLRIAKGEDN